LQPNFCRNRSWNHAIFSCCFTKFWLFMRAVRYLNNLHLNPIAACCVFIAFTTKYLQRMANQLTVTDYTTVQTPNSIGTLPANTIDSQPDYVWWITCGRFGSGSDLATNSGGIYLINLAADTWGKIFFTFDQYYVARSVYNRRK